MRGIGWRVRILEIHHLVLRIVTGGRGIIIRQKLTKVTVSVGL
jgi:hypothetical protein